VIKRGIKEEKRLWDYPKKNATCPWMVALRSINGLELDVFSNIFISNSLGRFRAHKQTRVTWIPLRGQRWI